MTESFLKMLVSASFMEKNRLENIIFKEMIRLIRIYVFQSCCSPSLSYNLICMHEIKHIFYIPSIPLLFPNIVLTHSESLTRLSGFLKGSLRKWKLNLERGRECGYKHIRFNHAFPFTSLYGTILIHLLSSCGLIWLMKRTNAPERGMWVFQH